MRKRKRRKNRRPRKAKVENLLSGNCDFISDTGRELVKDALKMNEAEGSTSGDLDNLLIQAFKNKIKSFANSVKPEVAIGLLASERLRKSKDISVEAVAYALEITAGTYNLLIDALEDRVSNDPLMKDALELLTSPQAKAVELSH